ncbi:patatin-like phospholipase family protein [Engelhardtia mirabilis]|uniref:PNPLA domain-containing protein n=1 Tax=Engelhardtia mirabilis TaxID=2528011 RepID=A0A518BQY8_9BACT|nr:hypothetical protein Pla133_45120 [Planctomycetes bacterium Pla133]QDV03719.1 hypothetical protein Pla86_45100 [Planctomycetes bacterium Pla86]
MESELALALTGGGARGAYQVGVLAALARARPSLEFDILTGVSAGAINAAFLAAVDGDLPTRTRSLRRLWTGIDVEDVIEVSATTLALNAARWALRLVSGGRGPKTRARGLVDTAPLAQLMARELNVDEDGRIPGIEKHLASGRHRSVAMTGSSYSSGRSVTWVAGREIRTWNRPNRVARRTVLGVEHVMASSALPLLFPAVEVEGRWYGDGGIRLSAPLAPAIHLGASRILAISTRFPRDREDSALPSIQNYPAPAQVGGVLLNAIFLDLLDQDALQLRRINRLLECREGAQRTELRPIELFVVRPSADLGRLANDYEARLPRALRFLTRGLGTRELRSNDLLSLLMFQADYVERLVELGEHDGERALPGLTALLD